MKIKKRHANTKAIITAQQYFYFWLASLGVFYLLILLANGDFSTAPIFLGFLFLGDVLFGVLVFLLLAISMFRNRNWKLLGISLAIFLLFFIILFSIPTEDSTTNDQKIDQNNPLVDCQIHANCGGDVKRMTQRECVNSTCCQIGNVNITIDVDECKLKQQEYANSNKPAPVTNVRIQQPITIPTIAPPEAPMCCRENCNSFTGTCTTKCERSWFCY